MSPDRPAASHSRVVAKILPVLLFFSLCHLSCQSARRAEQPLQLTREAQRLVLSNGLTVILSENRNIPFVSIHALIKAGSANEGKFTGSGISHFVEHVIFKGTDKYGVGEIERHIKALGGQISASTSFDCICCKILIPKENFKEGLLVLADILFNAAFPAGEFAKEKEVILSEMRLYSDNPQRRINDLLYFNAYAVHPYRYPIIGLRERFEAVSRDDLAEFYRTKFVPNNIVLAIAGDVERDAAFNSVTEIFSAAAPARLYDEPSIPEPRQVGCRKVTERYDTQPALLLMGYHSVSLSDEDLYPMDLLAEILAGTESSRLNTVLRQKKKLVYAIEAYNYTPREPGMFAIRAALEEKDAERAISEIQRQIEILKRSPPSRTELQRAKKRIESAILFNLLTIDEQAEDAGLNELIAGNPGFTRVYLEKIAGVKPEDISKAARAYLTKENLTVATILPKAKEREAQQAPAPAPVLPIRKFNLKNGIRVLVREDHSLPLVCIRASFSGGVRVENEHTQGISNLYSRLLLKGTRSKSAQDIAELLDSLGGEIYTESGNNSVSVGMNLQNQDLETVLAFLKELFTAATFPAAEVAREKEAVISGIKSEEKNVFEASERLLRKTLYKNHPFRFPQTGTEESIEGINREDILRFYREFCAPENMVLAVFGDVETDGLLERLKTFETIPARAFKPVVLEDEPVPAQRREAELRLEKEQALLTIAFLGTSIKDPERYPLEVLTSILSRGGGRIYNQIREELGLAYTLGSYHIPGLERGYYVFYVATAPDKITAAREKLMAIIESLKKEAPAAEEIESAKKDLTSAHRLGLQTNVELARQASLDELYGLGYEDYLHYEDKINAVTSGDLISVANKYFDLNAAVIVTTLPAPLENVFLTGPAGAKTRE